MPSFAAARGGGNPFAYLLISCHPVVAAPVEQRLLNVPLEGVLCSAHPVRRTPCGRRNLDHDDLCRELAGSPASMTATSRHVCVMSGVARDELRAGAALRHRPHLQNLIG